MNWLSNKLFYTIGITLLCGGLHAQSLAEAKKLYNEGKYAEAGYRINKSAIDI